MVGQPAEHCRRMSLSSCGRPGSHQTAHTYVSAVSFTCDPSAAVLPSLQLLPTSLGLNSKEFKFAFMTI